MRRGYAPTRERARADIAAGRVLVAGAPAARPSRQVRADEPIVVRGDPPRFVGRGGEKLDAALDRFAVDPAGMRVLDAGASTGGFTDCVVQRGAAAVIAVDVGYGQLHERLRADPRVIVRDRTNVRTLGRADLQEVGGPVDLVVADLAFISLTLVLGALAEVCREGGELVLLVKPQFEAGRAAVSRGRGIITDPEVWHEVLTAVVAACAPHGIEIRGVMPSPITGTEGNVEFLVHGVRGASARAAESGMTGSGTTGDGWEDDAGAIAAAIAEARAARGG